MNKKTSYVKNKKTHLARKGKPICKVNNKTWAYKTTANWVYVTCDNCWNLRVNC